jgi:hypothetical protein
MLEIVWGNKAHLQQLVVFALVFLAYWKGASPERQAALVFVSMFVFDRSYHWVFGPGVFILRANLGHIMIDAAALAAFVIVALRANRLYPLWLASFQLMIIVSHIVRAINPAMLNGVYGILAFVPSYLEVLAFGTGILAHIRRQARFGQYRSWQLS